MSIVSKVDICNRALQRVGAESITSIDDNNRNARTCKKSYDFIRRDELRKHVWRFAIKRAVLSPLADEPAFGGGNQFQLPTDCLRVIKEATVNLDWQVEGRTIISVDDKVNLRYVADIEDVTIFDPTFTQMLVLKMAEDMVEEMTQSGTKRDREQSSYMKALAEARRMNAFETVSMDPQTDSWILGRS